jgi:outer membrane protein TolC
MIARIGVMRRDIALRSITTNPGDWLFCVRAFLIFVLLFHLHGVFLQGDAMGTEGDGAVISLTLEEAINLALDANRNLVRSASGVESQRLSLASVESQFDLKIFPSTNLAFEEDYESIGGGISLEKEFGLGPRASVRPTIERSEIESQEKNYYGRTGFSLDVPLLRGFGKTVNLDSVRSSEYSVRSAERSLYLSKVNTVVDTVSAVYNVMEQRELVRLYDSQVQRLQGHAETAKIRERVGLATPIDVYRAQIRLKDAEDSLTQALESLRDAKDALKLILALPLERRIDVSAPVAYQPVNLDLNDAVKIALDNRIELEQAKDQIREAERRSRVSKHNLLPQLDIAMNYETYGSSEDFGHSLEFDEDRWTISLVSTTDWARTSERAAYRQSLIDIRTARLDLEARQDEITRDVRRQLDALRRAEERIDIREEQIRQAEGKLALARVKFNHGMADNFDVIEAESELQRARVDLLAVKTEYIVGTYNMRAVLGTLIERGWEPVSNAS